LAYLLGLRNDFDSSVSHSLMQSFALVFLLSWHEREISQLITYILIFNGRPMTVIDLHKGFNISEIVALIWKKTLFIHRCILVNGYIYK